MSAHRLSFLKECLTLRRVLLFVAGGILLTRLFTALVTPGYTYDRNAFALWGMRMAQLPASQFYAEGYFADYPPGYLWVLKLVGHLLLGLNLELEAPLTGFLLAVPVALAEAVLGCLLVWLAWPAGKKAGLAMAAWAMVNPTLWFDTGVWKQIDGVLALALVGCFVLLARKKWLWGAFVYGLALAVKPQALILGPVLAAAFPLPCLDKKQRLAQLGRTAAGAGIALLTVYLPAVPFHHYRRVPLCLGTRRRSAGAAGSQLDPLGAEFRPPVLEGVGDAGYCRPHGVGRSAGLEIRPAGQFLPGAAGSGVQRRGVCFGPRHARAVYGGGGHPGTGGGCHPPGPPAAGHWRRSVRHQCRQPDAGLFRIEHPVPVPHRGLAGAAAASGQRSHGGFVWLAGSAGLAAAGGGAAGSRLRRYKLCFFTGTLHKPRILCYNRVSDLFQSCNGPYHGPCFQGGTSL